MAPRWSLLAGRGDDTPTSTNVIDVYFSFYSGGWAIDIDTAIFTAI
jgi:hypothetical protein